MSIPLSENPKIYLIPSILAEGTALQMMAPAVVEVVKTTDYYFAENIKTARRYISELKTGRKIDEIIFYQLDKDTTKDEVVKLFDAVPVGKNIGVLSEAGCPGIADPGAMAVAIAHKRNWEVIPLPGPSSIFMALMASGFNGQNFCFKGYLPIDKEKKAKAFKALEKEAWERNTTQIIIETPYRNNKFLDEIIAIGNPETQLCIACDITGPHQFIQTKKLIDWKKNIPELNKKPAVFLFYGRN
jgi:16S rRNA (cytidine1402-2'-O)-methyltransferase